MQGLDQAIKTGKFAPVYLLYGDEDYLKMLYKKRLSAAMGDVDNSMNYSYYEGKDINPRAIIDEAETLPFFADSRLIVIENSGFFKNACDDLADYLKEPCESTRFLFVEREVDKRGRMYKAVSKAGRCVEMVTYDEEHLLTWAATLLKRNGKNIRKSTLLRLFSKSGTDMNSLSREILKLVDYVGDRDVIEDEDIDSICTVELKSRIFDMVDAITDGHSKKALDLYYDLLSLKEPPMRILFLISRQFNILLQVKELSSHTRDTKLLAGKTGLNPFIVKKYLDRAAKFSVQYLRSAVEECASLEEAVKTGQLGDNLSVELLIVKYSSRKAGKR